MLTVRLHAPARPESLVVEDVPPPEPAPGEVLIRFEASSVNPADLKIRNGSITPRGGAFPHTLGWDLVGRVSGPGPFALGARVAGMSMMAGTGVGTWSEFVALPAESLAVVEDDRAPAELAQLPLTGLTAARAIQAAEPQPGQDIAVIGANGGVGLLVVQLLIAQGLRPRAVVRDLDTVSTILVESGVEITQAVEPSSADRIIDAAGIDGTHGLRRDGRYIVVVPGTEPVRLPDGAQQITVYGAPSGALTARLLDQVRTGSIRLPTPTTFPLRDAPAAVDSYESRAPGSRIVLVGEDAPTAGGVDAG